MVSQLILRRALSLLEESFPNPSKEAMSAPTGEALRRYFAHKSELKTAIPCPFSLLLRAAQIEHLDDGMLPPVVGYEHPKYQLGYWLDDLLIAEIHIAYYGDDPDGLWQRFYKSIGDIDLTSGMSYNEFVDGASVLSRTIQCPFRRMKRILQNMLEDRKPYHHREEINQCEDLIEQRESSRKPIRTDGSKQEATETA